MRFKPVGNKKDLIANNILSDEASITILAGGPTFLKPDGLQPGISAVSAETLAAALQPFFWGFALTDVVPGALGEAIGFGMYDYARVLLTSRSATDATWASYSAIALGDIMAIVTTAGVQAVQRTGAGSASVLGFDVIAGQTKVSQTTQASSLGVQASQYWTTTLRVLIRRL
jgi:hypothetical protein